MGAPQSINRVVLIIISVCNYQAIIDCCFGKNVGIKISTQDERVLNTLVDLVNPPS